jgi:hypothetical protein
MSNLPFVVARGRWDLRHDCVDLDDRERVSRACALGAVSFGLWADVFSVRDPALGDGEASAEVGLHGVEDLEEDGGGGVVVG